MRPKKISHFFINLISCGLMVLAAKAQNSSGLQPITFHGESFFIRTIDPRKDDLRLFWNDDKGHRLCDFIALDKYVKSQGEQLVFGANAGMFEPDLKPVGLLIQNEQQKAALNLDAGVGNFYMKPNGVFALNQNHEAFVIESRSFTALPTPVVWATQSGPLLVLNGAVHPAFIKDSTNVNLRSGVGVRKDGTIVFAISRHEINFYDFATLFLTDLKCPNALYLDGYISSFYSPGIKDPMEHTFGPMFGLVQRP